MSRNLYICAKPSRQQTSEVQFENQIKAFNQSTEPENTFFEHDLHSYPDLVNLTVIKNG